MHRAICAIGTGSLHCEIDQGTESAKIIPGFRRDAVAANA